MSDNIVKDIDRFLTYTANYPMSDLHHVGVSFDARVGKNITAEEKEQLDKLESKGDVK